MNNNVNNWLRYLRIKRGLLTHLRHS